MSENEASLHRYKVVRGALDFGGVVGRTQSRSKYGGTCTDFFVEFGTHACISQETKEIVRKLSTLWDTFPLVIWQW